MKFYHWVILSESSNDKKAFGIYLYDFEQNGAYFWPYSTPSVASLAGLPSIAEVVILGMDFTQQSKC